MKRYKIQNDQERRGWVTAINQYDEQTGILKSQRAKYEHQVWWFILATLNGKDGMRMTVDDIQQVLSTFNVHYPTIAIRRGLRLIENPQHFVHPHIRGCSGKLVGVMEALGGLQKTYDWSPSNPLLFWLGNRDKIVDSRRQSFGILLT